MYPMNDSEFDQRLRDSSLPVAVPATFTRDVWRRVATTDASGWWPRAARLIEPWLGILALPPVAVTTCAATVILGAWFGRTPTPTNPTLEVAYIQSVSPFSHLHH